LLNKPK